MSKTSAVRYMKQRACLCSAVEDIVHILKHLTFERLKSCKRNRTLSRIQRTIKPAAQRLLKDAGFDLKTDFKKRNLKHFCVILEFGPTFTANLRFSKKRPMLIHRALNMGCHQGLYICLVIEHPFRKDLQVKQSFIVCSTYYLWCSTEFNF